MISSDVSDRTDREKSLSLDSRAQRARFALLHPHTPRTQKEQGILCGHTLSHHCKHNEPALARVGTEFSGAHAPTQYSHLCRTKGRVTRKNYGKDTMKVCQKSLSLDSRAQRARFALLHPHTPRTQKEQGILCGHTLSHHCKHNEPALARVGTEFSGAHAPTQYSHLCRTKGRVTRKNYGKDTMKVCQ